MCQVIGCQNRRMSDADASGLTAEEVELWRAFLRWSEETTAAVGAEIAATSDLSVTDFEVAIRLHDAGGELSQLTLGESLGWSASRLSHQLRRMESRGLVTRSPLGRGRAMKVVLTEPGRRELSSARAVQARSVRRYFIAPVDAHLARADFAATCAAATHLIGRASRPTGG
jgi:DNA-binding MarR family transcriptional regulator